MIKLTLWWQSTASKSPGHFYREFLGVLGHTCLDSPRKSLSGQQVKSRISLVSDARKYGLQEQRNHKKLGREIEGLSLAF